MQPSIEAVHVAMNETNDCSPKIQGFQPSQKRGTNPSGARTVDDVVMYSE